ncbi:hypothetical protein [Dongia sp.]|uniref:DUF7665 family protein n=1 Tax=Dongia sp. TaxID=1977262 RepID=UPI0037500A74
MAPDEAALRTDLASTRYRAGEVRGKWKQVGLEFPTTWFRVRAASRPSSPDWFLLKMNCAGYRGIAPTAQLWNGPDGIALAPALRPHSANGLMTAFSDWNQCLYHPIDRVARDHWPGKHADLAWSPDKDVVDYLEVVHGLLHDPEYVVSQAPAGAAYLPGETLEIRSA